MLIEDRIYGNFEITDPLALELIATPSFERLKHVNQFGLTQRHYPMHRGFFRQEHCLGVYILLNRLGAPRKEQIAGLIHDISHTAFSHLVDWVVNLDPRKENYQDNIHLSILRRQEISLILAKYGFSPEELANLESFGLLEKEIPDLCADRIDYSLRQMPEHTTQRALSSLTAQNGEIVFNDQDAARDFANDFLKQQVSNWGSYEAVTRYEILSRLFKEAISVGDLAFADFETDDETVLAKIIATGNKKYLETLTLLEKPDLSYLPKSDKPTYKKFRYVDPKILAGGNLMRLSEIDVNFKKRVEAAREENAKGICPGVLAV